MQINQPRVRVLVGDAPLAGAIAVEVEQVAYFAAGRFVVTVALGDAAYFATLGLQTITIGVAVSAAGFVDLLTGQIDNIRVDLLENTAVLSGRDLSARLIDAQISESFVNQTASEIAVVVAGRHGLAANVTPTTTPVGQYYQLDHARNALAMNSRNGSEWNMLSALAQAEGFGLSVTGTILNFGPVAAVVPVVLTPGDCMALGLDMATTIPSCATVKSWNTRNKAVVTQTAGVQPAGVTLVRPNLSNAQASNLAANHLSALQRHAVILRATIPGETVLTPASPIMLSGTNSALDQIYVIDSIVRSIDMRNGFVETIHAHAAS